MRLQNRLLGLHHPGQPPAFRRYLVREMDRVVAGLDSGDLLDYLLGRFGVEEAGEGHQARLTVLDFLPRHVHRLYGPTTSLHSVVLGDERPEDPATDSALGPVPARLFSEEARGCLDLVLRRIPRIPEPERGRALLALAPFEGPALEEALREWALGTPPDPLAAHLWVRRNGADPGFLTELQGMIESHPEVLVAATATAPTLETSAFVMAGLERWDPDRAVPLGVALGGSRDAHRGTLFDRLVESRKGWAVLQGLASLSRVGEESDLELVLGALDRFRHPVLRVEAARSLGRMDSPRAREACAGLVTRDPSSREAGAALEALARQPVPDADRERIFGMALSTHSPEVLALGCLGLIGLDPDRAARAVLDLLGSDATARRHGAHVLGYLDGQRVIRVLSGLVLRDPDPGVRHQAALALGNLPPSEGLATATLMIFSEVDPELRSLMAQVAVRAAPSPTGEMVEALERGSAALDPVARSEILAAIGGTGLAEARDLLERAANTGEDEEVQVGAWKGLAAFPRSDATDTRSTESGPPRSPRIEAARAIALLASDPAAALSRVEALLAGDDAAFSHGVLALETLGFIVRTSLEHPRYSRTRDWIRDLLGKETAPAPAPGAPETRAPVSTGPASTGPASTGPVSTRPASTAMAVMGHAPVAPESLLVSQAPPAQAQRVMDRIPEAPPRRGGRRFRERPLDLRGVEDLRAPPRTLAFTGLGAFLIFFLIFNALLAPDPPATLAGMEGADFLVIRSLTGPSTADGARLAEGAVISLPVTLESIAGPMELSFQSGRGNLSIEGRMRLELLPARGIGVMAQARELDGSVILELSEQGRMRFVLDPGIVTFGPGRHRIEGSVGDVRVTSEKGRMIVVDGQARGVRLAAPAELEIDDGVVDVRR